MSSFHRFWDGPTSRHVFCELKFMASFETNPLISRQATVKWPFTATAIHSRARLLRDRFTLHNSSEVPSSILFVLFAGRKDNDDSEKQWKKETVETHPSCPEQHDCFGVTTSNPEIELFQTVTVLNWKAVCYLIQNFIFHLRQMRADKTWYMLRGILYLIAVVFVPDNFQCPAIWTNVYYLWWKIFPPGSSTFQRDRPVRVEETSCQVCRFILTHFHAT